MLGCMTHLGGKSVFMVKPQGKEQLALPMNRRDNNVKHLNERLLGFFNPEDGSDRLSRNVDKELTLRAS